MGEVETRIQQRVNQTLNELPEHIRRWSVAHLIAPRKVTLATDPDGEQYADFWLVTDHTGSDDASYRVVFDEETDDFGLEVTLNTGVCWYMGSYGSSFAVTVDAM
jgi:hypothetical protein